MVSPVILIEDSVGDQLGFARPLERLESFLPPNAVEAVRGEVLHGDGDPISIDCVDVNGTQVDGYLTVRRSGAFRLVSLTLAGEDPSEANIVTQKGALGDGTVLWKLNVRSGEVHVEHRSGTANQTEPFTVHYRTWLESIRAHDRQMLDSQVQAVIAGGRDLHSVVRMVLPDGGERVIEAFGRAIVVAGVTIEVAGMSIDVSSRVAATKEMADQAARLEMSLTASGMGTWDWDIGLNVVTWSDKVAEMFCIPAQDFAGDFRAYESFIHPDDLESVHAGLENCLSGAVPDYAVSHRAIMPNGDVKWLDAKGALFRDVEGQPVRFLGTVWDSTTSRKQQEHIARIERDLVRASDRFRLVSESAGIGLWDLDVATQVVTWDPQMCALFGLEQQGYVGPLDIISEVIHPEDRGRTGAEYLESLESGQGTQTFRIVLADGVIRHLMSFGQMISAEEGPRFVGLCLDLSERREAELRERNRNRVLEAVVSTASVQEVLNVLVEVLEEEEVGTRIRFMLLDASGRYLVNGAATSLPEFYLDQTNHLEIGLGNGTCGTAAALLAPVVTEDVQLDPEWQPFLEQAQAASIRACCAVPVIGSTGKLLGTLAAYFRTPRASDDDLIRHMTAAADFAALAIERKNAEIASRNRELLLESMGEIAGMGGWELDLLSGIRTWTNQMHKLLDLNPDTSVRTVLELYTPESQARLVSAMKRSTDTGEPWSLELELMTPIGRHVWIRSEGRAQSAGGRVVRLFGAVQDITAKKQAELEFVRLQEQLLHSQKLESIGRLAGGVAHDFNNIVSVILGHAELAMETVSEGSELMEDLNEIRLAAERSAALTHQLLAFARKQPMSPVLVNINDTIAVMVNMLRRLIGGQIALSWESEPDLWSVFVDPAQIDQILANLCVNARDAIGKRGSVKISTANVVLCEEDLAEFSDCLPGSYVCLSVADDGAGIPENVLENIFEPFFTTKGVGQGTGLGLATVYGIVKQNRGGIRVASEIGLGSRFEVYLPRHDQPATRKPDRVSERTPVRLFSTILLVDDELTVLKVARRMLEGLGHEVHAALGPKEAVRLAAQLDHIDVLLTDVIMPEMNGKELSELLTPLHPEMTVVLMSGYTAEVLAEEGFLQEAYFLQKPFSLSELGEIVMEALNPS